MSERGSDEEGHYWRSSDGVREKRGRKVRAEEGCELIGRVSRSKRAREGWRGEERPLPRPTHTAHIHALWSEVHPQFTLTITTSRRKRAAGRTFDVRTSER